MLVREAGRDAAAWGAVEKTNLDEEGFVDLFESILLFGEGGGESVEADRTAIIFLDDGAEQAAIKLVEAVGVDFQHFEGSDGGGAVDFSGGANFSEVSHTAQKTVRDARCAARAHGDLGGAVAVDGNTQDFCRPLDDPAKFVVGVELQAKKDAEARAQRGRQQARACGRRDKGEGVDAHDVRASRRAGADHDVELIILERGVELFFHDGLEAMDLVEEEDLFGLEVGEDGGHVALDLQGGAGRLLKTDVELIRNDRREGGFAEAGRSEEEDVVERLAARFGGLERNGQLLFRFGLADELGEALGAQFELDGVIVIHAAGGD